MSRLASALEAAQPDVTAICAALGANGAIDLANLAPASVLRLTHLITLDSSLFELVSNDKSLGDALRLRLFDAAFQVIMHRAKGHRIMPFRCDFLLARAQTPRQVEAAAREALAAGRDALDVLLPVSKLPPPLLAADSQISEPPLAIPARPGAPPGPAQGHAAVVGVRKFRSNWDVFTMGQLEGLDWTNIVAAGGSVLACATIGAPPPPTASAASLRPLLLRTKPSQIDQDLVRAWEVDG